MAGLPLVLLQAGFSSVASPCFLQNEALDFKTEKKKVANEGRLFRASALDSGGHIYQLLSFHLDMSMLMIYFWKSAVNRQNEARRGFPKASGFLSPGSSPGKNTGIFSSFCRCPFVCRAIFCSTCRKHAYSQHMSREGAKKTFKFFISILMEGKTSS